MKHRVAILTTRPMAESIFSAEDLAFLNQFADCNKIEDLPETLSDADMQRLIRGADACVTCWGTPKLTEAMLQAAPDLKLVAHAAGTIKNLIPPALWQTRCRVTSNAPVIAEDVAQTVLALTLTSLLGLWGNAESTRAGGWQGGESGQFKTKKINGLKIGLVGYSSVCREVITLFKVFDCDIRVWDPYVCPMEMRQAGVTWMPLDDLMASCDVVSLHAPANEDCRHLIHGDNLRLLQDGALFINTARGMIVDEAALIRELETGRIFACIDVTDPEPPAVDHPFRKMHNVILTSHVAGGHTANGRKRLGANAILQIYNYLTKGLLANEVRQEMLEHMA